MDGHTTPLEIQIGLRLAATGKTLATAESCSGGLVAHLLTNVPGASAYFLGGIVAYSNGVKTAMLGVVPSTLDAYGAVSDAVALEMAEGARNRFNADYATACTGIAGPSGGTPEKPVGLVYTAVACAEGTWVQRNLFAGSRDDIKQKTAEAVLGMLLERLS